MDLPAGLIPAAAATELSRMPPAPLRIALFSAGVNEMQTWAYMCGDRSLELSINREGLQTLQSAFNQVGFGAESEAAKDLEQLAAAIHTRASKHLDVLLISARCARALGESGRMGCKQSCLMRCLCRGGAALFL